MDTDNTLLTKIARSCAEIERAISKNIPQPQGQMDVTVTNFPNPQNVAVTNFPASIEVNNFPGSVNAVVTNTPNVTVTNFPSEIAINNLPGVQNVAFPAAQPVDVLSIPPVEVSNFPATQPISGSVAINNFPVSFQVSNFPPSQDVVITNAPNVAVTNFPATQPVSAASLPLPSGAATESTLVNRASETTLASRASESTLSTRATETTLASRASESTLAGIKAGTDRIPASPSQEHVTASSPVSVRLSDGAAFYTAGNVVPTTYSYIVPATAVGSNKLFLDIFNGIGSGKILRVRGIFPIADTDIAVNSVLGIRVITFRTSSAGTGGTIWNYRSPILDIAGGSVSPLDTSNAAIPAQITARHLPTAGATTVDWLHNSFVVGEETATSFAYAFQGQFNMLDDLGTSLQSLTFREGEGLLIRQGAVASIGNIAFRVVFTLE